MSLPVFVALLLVLPPILMTVVFLVFGRGWKGMSPGRRGMVAAAAAAADVTTAMVVLLARFGFNDTSKVAIVFLVVIVLGMYVLTRWNAVLERRLEELRPAESCQAVDDPEDDREHT